MSLCFVIFLIAGASFSNAQEQNQALGELKLEGEYIESLILERKDGATEKFRMPAETVKLPPGKYQLKQVRLKGGYSNSIATLLLVREWITITEDEPAVLKVGAPLKHTVEVKRQGEHLVLNYKLLGVGVKAILTRTEASRRFLLFTRERKKLPLTNLSLAEAAHFRTRGEYL